MQSELDTPLSRVETHDPTENSSFEILARVQQDLENLIAGLALVGIKRCSRCRQFFRSTDPGSLFEFGLFVCYGCIPDWWPSYSTQIGTADKERVSGKLASWLRKYHSAEVVKEIPGKVANPNNDAIDAFFNLVSKCQECAGSGSLLEGERCRFCNGFGKVRIVVRG